MNTYSERSKATGTPVCHLGVAPQAGTQPIGLVLAAGAMCYAWDAPYSDGEEWHPVYTIEPPEPGMVGVRWTTNYIWEHAGDQTWEYPEDLERMRCYDLAAIRALAQDLEDGRHQTILTLAPGEFAASLTSTKWDYCGPGEVFYLIHTTDIIVTPSDGMQRRYR